MTRLPSLRIHLVESRAGGDAPWSLDDLTAHLEAAGHSVERSCSARPTTTAAPDVVHCFGLTAVRDLAVAGVTSSLLVTPAAEEPLLTEGEDLHRVLGATASAVVRSSSEQERVHRLGIPWFRTWVLPVAVDPDTFTRIGPMARRTERFRLVAELSGPADGMDDVITALARLDDVELVVLVAERGSAVELGARENAFRAAAARAGVSDRVVVVAPSSGGERAWWLRSAHVAVAVPHAPPCSDFVAEAMACGAPVVATPVDALADLVVHGVTGFHVPPADPLSVARAVRTVLADEFSVESYGMAAADRALSRFAWPRVVHELVGVYRRVAAMDGGVEEPDVEAEGLVLDDPDLPIVLDDASIA